MYKAKKRWTIKRVINTNNIIMDDFNIPLLDQVGKNKQTNKQKKTQNN